MIDLPDIIKGVWADWGPRPESREACVDRVFGFIEAACKTIRESGEAGLTIKCPAKADVILSLKQNRTDIGNRPIERLGWSGTLLVGVGSGNVMIGVNCGAWTLGNYVRVSLPDPLREDLSTNLALLRALVAQFEPDCAAVVSREGQNRYVARHEPLPIVDWIVYLRNVSIAPEDLPMVHSVESFGSGTLIVTKPTRIHLSAPSDSALIDAVEPIIRLHQRQEDLAVATHPEHKGLH
jgi:hypothetical protein